MRSLPEIIRANQEAVRQGVKFEVAPIGVRPVDDKPIVILTPERMRALGLHQY